MKGLEISDDRTRINIEAVHAFLKRSWAANRTRETLMNHSALQNYRLFTVATKDAHGLYEKLGFKTVELNWFMEIKNDSFSCFGRSLGIPDDQPDFLTL